MTLLQVCNVGDLCGGTLACAWTITRSLPRWRHVVACLSRVTGEARRAFGGCDVIEVSVVDESLVARMEADFVILHNVSPERVREPGAVPTLQYAHSRGRHAPGDLKVACSTWLARQLDPVCPVLYQAVPVPPLPRETAERALEEELVIGRLCTPRRQKWPAETVDFYGELAGRFPHVRWEFVGAPEQLRSSLQSACRGRGRFLTAGWSARSHLWRWHALLYQHATLTESFGRTCAEGMRAGCVPIVDNRGGFREQIATGETGFLCEGREDFAAALSAIHDRERRQNMSRRAREFADRHFSEQSFTAQLAVLMEHYVASSRRVTSR